MFFGDVVPHPLPVVTFLGQTCMAFIIASPLLAFPSPALLRGTTLQYSYLGTLHVFPVAAVARHIRTIGRLLDMAPCTVVLLCTTLCPRYHSTKQFVGRTPPLIHVFTSG